MERPIAYSTEMVLATLDGRKSKTRRVCKHQHWSHSELVDVNINGISQKVDRNVSCPYGQKGDILWVREEHLITFSEDKCWITVEFKDGYKFTVYFKEMSLILLERLRKRKTLGKWQRARFLPKEFARLWLKVNNVRVERLQDISNIDALAEGIETGPMETDPFSKETLPTYKIYGEVDRFIWTLPAVSFKSLWRSINGPDSWAANPWVWVVQFKVVSTTGRANVKEVQA